MQKVRLKIRLKIRQNITFQRHWATRLTRPAGSFFVDARVTRACREHTQCQETWSMDWVEAYDKYLWLGGGRPFHAEGTVVEL